MSDPAGPDDERGSRELAQPHATPPAPDQVAPGGRRASLARRVRGRARAAVGLLADRLMGAAPRIPVRDLATLRRQFPGLDAEQVADRLVTGAATGTAGVGAGIGAAAALPVPPAMTAELATETLAVAAVEYKLIAELHEVYGLRAPGTAQQRAAAYLGAWAQQRGISVARPATVDAALGGHLKRRLRQRLVRRTATHLPTLAPFMIGATIGAVLNRHSTRALADRVRRDLRERQIPWGRLPDLPDA